MAIVTGFLKWRNKIQDIYRGYRIITKITKIFHLLFLNEVRKERLSLRSKVRVGTWNVCSSYESGKLANLLEEMKRLKMEILGVAEMWWRQAGVCHVSGWVMYYSIMTEIIEKE